MTRCNLGLPVGAINTTPVSAMYTRASKEGTLQMLNFLIGSHYNVNPSGILSTTSVGNIADQSINTTGGLLNMIAKSSDGSLIQNIATFTSFMYFFPKTAIEGHAKLAHATVTAGQTEKIRHIMTDLATTDALIIDWAAGVTGTTNATLTIQQITSGVTTTIATFQAPTNVPTECYFEVVYLDSGGTTISYMLPGGVKTLLWQGTLTANLAECKVQVIEYLTATSDTTLSSDFFWIFYPAVFCGYDVPTLSQRVLGNCKCWDDMGSGVEANWVQVFSQDHKFTGQPVIENGLIRLRPQTTTPGIDVYGWSVGAGTYQYVSTLRPEDSNGNLATVLFGIVFTSFSEANITATVKWGVLDWEVDIRRGCPYSRVMTNSTHFIVNTTKARFCISAPSPYTASLIDFNQKGSAAANGGNPLNLSVPTNPFTFTDNTDSHTGLRNTDDNYYCFYNNTSSDDMLFFVSTIQRPIGIVLTATDATHLAAADFQWSTNTIIAVGVLEGNPSALISSVPTPFVVSTVDTYIKWRSNEAIYTFEQSIFARRKR